MTHGDSITLAHGVGGPQDLPIPASYAFVAAACALLLSFVVLAFAWRTARFRGDESGRPVPAWLARVAESPITRYVVVVAGLAFAAWVTMAAILGRNTLVNPTFGSVFVLLWVGLVPAALLFGPIYRLCNPLRWIHRGLCAAAGTRPDRGFRDYPERLGLWPAAFTLFAFVWLELVDPRRSSELASIRLWFALLAVFLIGGAALYGSTWFARADPFEVCSSLVARLSPFGRRTDGVLVLRNPLENLDGLTARPGLLGVVAVLFGSTGFDSFKDTVRWLKWTQPYSEHSALINTAGLVVFVVAVYASFSLATIATAGIGHVPRRELPNLLAHSVIPIVVGYIAAHYLSYFIAAGWGTVEQLGDPLSRGWNLTSWASNFDKYELYSHPTAIAVTKVIAVICGHVLGVISVHDRALKVLPRRHSLSGQLPMLFLMVAYTLTGLGLLFAS